MKIAALRGARTQAPENSLNGLIGAYVAGADVLELGLQMTADRSLVLAHENDTARLTGRAGSIRELTLAELHARGAGSRLNYPVRFSAWGAQIAYRQALEVFDEILDRLPDEVWLLVRLGHESVDGDAARRADLVSSVVDHVSARGRAERTILYSDDRTLLAMARGESGNGIRIAYTGHWDGHGDAPDAILDDIAAALDLGDSRLTAWGQRLGELHRTGTVPLGAILASDGKSAFATNIIAEIERHDFVWALGVDSVLAVAAAVRDPWLWLDESFEGKRDAFDTRRFARGYARANPDTEVFQNDGIVIEISPYKGQDPYDPNQDAPQNETEQLREDLLMLARDTPYYSGGGFGVLAGIEGDFAAEVDVASLKAQQATTVEMAVLNVDPPVDRPRRPTSFRDRKSFYDPHGAPPYVGVEHDEEDGWRINWNLGTDYESNQYGKVAGEGNFLEARMRLDRRGPHFAAYFRPLDQLEWVCVGAVRNDSLNPRVYLRCVGKRWRQERENPQPGDAEFVNVIANTFTFRNLTITRFRAR